VACQDETNIECPKKNKGGTCSLID
jgi:hypothetical protein